MKINKSNIYSPTASRRSGKDMEIIKKPMKKNGRPAAEGKKRQYVIPDDVHAWIMRHGGSRYITDIVRAIKAATLNAQGQQQKSEENKEDSNGSSPSVQASDFKQVIDHICIPVTDEHIEEQDRKLICNVKRIRYGYPLNSDSGGGKWVVDEDVTTLHKLVEIIRECLKSDYDQGLCSGTPHRFEEYVIEKIEICEDTRVATVTFGS